MWKGRSGRHTVHTILTLNATVLDIVLTQMNDVKGA